MPLTKADIEKMSFTLNAKQVAEILGVARNTAYTLMHIEGFPTLHVGRRLLVPKDKLLQWMDDHLE
jgi:excisionase family DNA binding protein